MTLFFEQYNNTGIGDIPAQFGGEAIGFGEAFTIQLHEQILSGNVDSKVLLLNKQIDPILDLIEEREGKIFKSPAYIPGTGAPVHYTDEEMYTNVGKLAEYVSERPDLYPEYADLSGQKIYELAYDEARESMTRSADAAERQTWMGVLGSFLGQTAGAITDDVFVEQMLFFRGKGASGGMAAKMLKEGLLGAGTEAYLQIGIADWYDELGMDYTYGDFLTAVGAGFTFGAAIPPVVSGGSRALHFTNAQVTKGLDVLAEAGYLKRKEVDVVNHAFDDLDQLTRSPDMAMDTQEYLNELDRLINIDEGYDIIAKEKAEKWFQRNEEIDDMVDRGEIDKDQGNKLKLDSKELKEYNEAKALKKQSNDNVDEFINKNKETDQPLQYSAPDSVSEDVVNLVDDLNRGADEATILNNPAIQSVEQALIETPETINAPNYGSVEWDLNRSFVDPATGQNITGTQSLVRRVYDDAKILAWTADKLPVPQTPIVAGKRAIIVLGPPAAGKSSIANPIARKHNAAIIDADEAKKFMPEFAEGRGANAVHEESSQIAEVALAQALGDGINVVIPKVGGNDKSIKKLIERLRNYGYEIDIVGMDVKAEVAMSRMIQRFINEGRYVPYNYLKSVGDKPMTTYNNIKREGLADGYAHIDNNATTRTAPKPVIEDTRGLLEGTDLRLRRDRLEGPGMGGQPRRPGEDQAVASKIEQFVEANTKANKASANLERGRLPDDAPEADIERPLPQETRVTEKDVDATVDQVEQSTDFANIPDEEILYVDMVDGDQVISKEMTGAEVKAQLAQDEAMVNSLSRCII